MVVDGNPLPCFFDQRLKKPTTSFAHACVLLANDIAQGTARATPKSKHISAFRKMAKELGFDKTSLEQELLQQVCDKHKVPQLLVSKLLNAEFETQGMTRHSKVFGKINKILAEEWRDDYDEIMKDMINEREEKEKAK